MGDDSRISFWFDSWSPVGQLAAPFDRDDMKRSRVPSTVTMIEVFTSPYWIHCTQGYTLGGPRKLHRHQRAFFDRVRALIPSSTLPVVESCDLWCGHCAVMESSLLPLLGGISVAPHPLFLGLFCPKV